MNGRTEFPRRMLAIAALGAVLVALGACAPGAKQHGPGQINHVVLFELERPEDAAELQRDCESMLKPLPQVSYYACGAHVEVGRPTVNGDYTLGLIVSFDDRRSYDEYLVAPEHVGLVEKWKPRFTKLTIYDIGNAELD